MLDAWPRAQRGAPTHHHEVHATMSLGIADQFKTAIQVRTRVPAIIGAVLGALVPIAAFGFSHFHAANEPGWYFALRVAFVAACLGFSIPKVYKVSKAAFGTGEYPRVEAMAFALLLECAMTLADHTVLAHRIVSYACLVVLVMLNALVCACAAALDQKERTAEQREEAKAANLDTLSLAPTVLVSAVAQPKRAPLVLAREVPPRRPRAPKVQPKKRKPAIVQRRAPAPKRKAGGR